MPNYSEVITAATRESGRADDLVVISSDEPLRHRCAGGAHGRLLPITGRRGDGRPYHAATCDACGATRLSGLEAHNYGAQLRAELKIALACAGYAAPDWMRFDYEALRAECIKRGLS